MLKLSQSSYLHWTSIHASNSNTVAATCICSHSIKYVRNVTYDHHMVEHQVHLEEELRHIFISNGLLSPLIVVIASLSTCA